MIPPSHPYAAELHQLAERWSAIANHLQITVFDTPDRAAAVVSDAQALAESFHNLVHRTAQDSKCK